MRERARWRELRAHAVKRERASRRAGVLLHGVRAAVFCASSAALRGELKHRKAKEKRYGERAENARERKRRAQDKCANESVQRAAPCCGAARTGMFVERGARERCATAGAKMRERMAAKREP